MRNDVFHTDKAKVAAEERLRNGGATTAQIAKFLDRAPHASTPAQIAELEREAKE